MQAAQVMNINQSINQSINECLIFNVA